VGAALPLSLGWSLIVLTVLSGLIAGIVTVKLLKPRACRPTTTLLGRCEAGSRMRLPGRRAK
jgi:hypothetical protein